MLKNRESIQKSLFVLGIGVVFAFAWFLMRPSSDTVSSQNTRQFQNIQFDEQTYEVVVSRTPAELQQGLSDTNEIGADGMLFIFPAQAQPTFWMYRMNYDLDFIWIADGVVVDLHRDVPAPDEGTAQKDIAQVRPKVPSDAVLEVPSGFIDRFGITMGMTFQMVGEPVDKIWKSSKLLQE